MYSGKKISAFCWARRILEQPEIDIHSKLIAGAGKTPQFLGRLAEVGIGLARAG
jgi:hypothetical protein